MTHRWTALLVASTLGLAPVCARAQQDPPNPALAERLFRDAEALFKQGKTREACEKFAESNRAEFGLGTLMNLAICHEKEGKIASAWAEYVEVAQRSSDAKSSSRAKNAAARAAALEPRLSYVTIAFASGPEAAFVEEVRIDGRALGRGAWSTAIPLDPGPHTVAFGAPGRVAVSKAVDVAGPGTQTVEAPTLEPSPRRPRRRPSRRRPRAIRSPRRPPSRRRAAVLRAVGCTLGGVGLAAVVTGAVFGVRAFVKGSEGACEGAICENQDAVDARESARTSATVANLAIGIGAVVAGAGVVLVLTAPRSHTAAQVGAVRLSANPLPGGGALQLGGRF